MGSLPSTFSTWIWVPWIAWTSTRPSAPGVTSTILSNAASESARMKEFGWAAIKALVAPADILHSRPKTCMLMAEFLVMTTTTLLPFGHFFISDFMIFSSSGEVTLPEGLSLGTTTARWWAQAATDHTMLNSRTDRPRKRYINTP